MMRYLLYLCLIVAPAAAQGQLVFEGCQDLAGRPVASIQSVGINDIAVATMQGGAPVIFYNPMVLQTVHPVVRRYFYAHECAHHRLGHLVAGLNNVQSEQQADCWAAHAIRASGATDADMGIIAETIARMARGDWTHLPGPMRAINLRACLAVPPPTAPPMAFACCDGYGMRRCPLNAPSLAGSPCMCPGQGIGRACP